MTSQVEITDGLSVSLSTLAREFGMARETCKKRLQQAGVASSGKHKGHDIFRIGAAARAILAPEIENAREEDPEKMSPKDRLDWYRGARERTKHMEECGDLMRAADFETALASAIKTIAVTLESLPDVMERDAGIDGAAVERCQVVVDRMREDLHKRLTTPATDA